MGWAALSLTLCWLGPCCSLSLSPSAGWCLWLSPTSLPPVFPVSITPWALICYLFFSHYVLLVSAIHFGNYIVPQISCFFCKNWNILALSYNKLCDLIWLVYFFTTTLTLRLSSYFLLLFSESVAGLDFRSPTDVTGQSPWKVPVRSSK